MLPKDFVKLFYPDALSVEKQTGISAIATLAQAALESGWNEHTVSNNFFGQKDTDKDHSNAVLITTTEYSLKANLSFPEIISITPYTDSNGNKKYKYLVKDWFVAYPTPADCFKDHANFFLKNPRYAEAVKVGHDPVAFVTAVAAAGYATDPNYAKLLTSLIHTIQSNL